MQKLGIIGGSGIYSMKSLKIIEEHEVKTPFGAPSDKIVEAEFEGQRVYFLPRHGRNHRFLPSEVNYRANIFALKSLGVNVLLSISAVGSLKEEFAPRCFVLPDQFIDWTKGKRERSFFGNGMVGHVSVAYPVEAQLRERAYNLLQELNIESYLGGAYVCIEGPQFSSRAESNVYRQLGAEIIGMTNVPEAYLAKEAGMAYATVAMVTDYDCWKEEHCSLEEILAVMKHNTEAAQKFVEKYILSLSKNPLEFEPENRQAVMTREEFLSDEHKQIIEVLIK